MNADLANQADKDGFNFKRKSRKSAKSAQSAFYFLVEFGSKNKPIK